jgi:2-polyprenyl-3-methyl-5-hydroxy-6-metoxy-1,4-benzoquinol methylase
MARHIYEYEVDLASDTAAAHVIRMTGRSRRVLEVGAGAGSITKHLIQENGCDVVAIEIERASIERLTTICPKVYELDLNKESWPDRLDGEDKFDVVIAADVLEHTYNPLQTLIGMKSLLREDGEIILSLPHVGHSAVMGCIMNEDFEYRDWGLLDRTHIRFFGIKNINQLHQDAGLSIVDAHFVVRRPAETEFADTWTTLPPAVRKAIETNPFGQVYQVVSKAQPRERARAAIDLTRLSVQGPTKHRLPVGIGDGLVKGGAARAFLRKYAWDATKERLRSMAARLRLHV